ncbi:MAG: ATP-binding protein [Gammaproteobacteria bacterium]|nr:ATP-binding protein [Gammaproteobacteria bacterium]
MKLKWKILLLLVLTLSASMLLAGGTLSVFIAQNYDKKINESFNRFNFDFKNAIDKTKNDLKSSAISLSLRSSLISSLNLVSSYSDNENYQPVIFDKEKTSIADMLVHHARAAKIDHIRVYDVNGGLVSFADNEQRHMYEGFVTYNNSNAEINSRKSNASTEWGKVGDKYWRESILLGDLAQREGVYFSLSSHGVGVEVVVPVSRVFPDKTSSKVGSVVLTKLIENEFIDFVAKGDATLHAIVDEARVYVGDDIDLVAIKGIESAPRMMSSGSENNPWFSTASYFIQAYSIDLISGKKLYLVSALDKSIVDSDIYATQKLVLFVFIVVLLVVTPVSLVFSRKIITNPVHQLVTYARAIEDGDYKAQVVKLTNDEFSMLAQSLEHAAHKINDREDDLLVAHTVLEERVKSRTDDLRATNYKLEQHILEKQHIEEALRDSRNMLLLIMNNIPQYIFWKDVDSVYLGCNANFLKVAGVESDADIVGKTDFDMPWTEAETKYYQECDRRVMADNKAELHIQETQRTAEGKTIYLDTNKVPLHDAKGKVIGVLGSFEDITSRIVAENELLDAKEKAEMASQAKSDFMSRMSHELRTPLNAILGFSQLLELDDKEPLTRFQQSSVAEIVAAGKHLLHLINEILDLTSIESGRLSINQDKVDLLAIVNDSVQLVSHFLENRGLTLSIGEKQSFHVYVDAIRLRQVCVNLLSNAIKYNRKNGKININFTLEANNYVRVSVSDTGQGLSQDNIDKLFTPFERLDVDKDAIDGTGIGLVITKELVELMSGEVGVDSELGKGSSFWFTVPLALDSSDDVLDLPMNIGEKEEPMVIVPDEKTILYIEDNLANIKLVEKILAMRPNIKLVCVNNAEEGVQVAQDLVPDLVLMDISLPGMNGDEAVVVLRKNELTSAIPVYAVSANAMKEDIDSALDKGFTGYMTKPVNVSELLDIVDSV